MRSWKTLSSRIIHQDQWISLRADQCELEDKTIVDPYYVLEEKEWVAIFAFDEHDRILLVNQYRHAGGIFCTELPGGGVEDGEDPVAAARRELREETGFDARSWSSAGSLWVNPARQTNRLHVFVASDLVNGGSQDLDHSEEISIQFVDIKAVKAMIRNGEFSQALHVAAFHLGCEIAKDAH